MFELRTAQPQDARELSEFSERAFCETFASYNSAEDMAIYTTQTFGLDKQSREIADPARRIVVAIESGEIIGYFHLVVGRPERCVADPNSIELLRFYVDARWHGKQVAQRLMQEAIDRSCGEGFSTMWLGVWEKNMRAQAFYKKWGFAEVGAHLFQLGSDPQRDLIYSRGIGAAPRY